MKAEVSSATSRPAPAQFSIAVDTSGAEAVLAAATADQAHAAGAADAALANPAVRALIAKMARYNPRVTPESFKAAVLSLAGGGSGTPFDLDRLRGDPAPTRRMLDRLRTERPAIEQRLAARLRAFTPDGLAVRGTMFVLVGAMNQNGWVPDPRVGNFYVDLAFHGEEVESVVTLAAHELFHVVQGNGRASWDPEFSDRPDLPPDARERHRAHAVLLNLVLEGMATYVGDPALVASPGPHLLRDQREISRNLNRSREIFALFDTVLYRARHDPDAPLDELLSIGFGGGWDQTGYYVGYRMAKAIDRYRGTPRLRALVTAQPEDFVAEYIAIAAAHPDDPEITRLSAGTVAVVEDLRNSWSNHQ